MTHDEKDREAPNAIQGAHMPARRDRRGGGWRVKQGDGHERFQQGALMPNLSAHCEGG
jgi:hypothetical protein